MKNEHITLDHCPPRVGFEELPDGVVAVRLYDSIRDEAATVEDGPEIQEGEHWVADEVAFVIPADRAEGETAETIENNFASWWMYGEGWEGAESAPTVEERLEVIEDFMAAMLED